MKIGFSDYISYLLSLIELFIVSGVVWEFMVYSILWVIVYDSHGNDSWLMSKPDIRDGHLFNIYLNKNWYFMMSFVIKIALLSVKAEVNRKWQIVQSFVMSTIKLFAKMQLDIIILFSLYSGLVHFRFHTSGHLIGEPETVWRHHLLPLYLNQYWNCSDYFQPN